MLLQRPPPTDGCKLVIDETGVGRAVGDIFYAAGLRPNRVTITAGQEATDPHYLSLPERSMPSKARARHRVNPQWQLLADTVEKSRLGMEKSYPPLLRPEPLELRLLLVTQVRMEIVDRVVHASDRLSHRFQPRLCGLKAGRRGERALWRTCA